MIPQEAIRNIIENGISEFSQNYILKLKKKETFTVEDMKTAFIDGAKWMQSFFEVTTMMQKQL